MKNIFLTVLVILASCSPEKEVPEDLISQKQMVALMTEIHLLESKINNLSIRPIDSAKVVYAHYEKLLFRDFNITEDQYERSYNYYVDNTNEFKKIYEIVVDSLMQKEKLEID